MSATVLVVRNMSKTLKSNAYRFDLSIPTLSLESGCFYGLVGKSGSGKSTMLDLLAMVSAPSSVERFDFMSADTKIDIAKLLESANDREISQLRLQNFGYILQSGGLFSFLTVRRNLELPLRLSGRTARPGEIEDITRPFEIEEHLDKYPAALSGGQRQRVSILRALCLSPAIVLADEPTASVDENMAEFIVGELKNLAAIRGSTVLMVSHDIELVKKFADEIFLLRPELVVENHMRSKVQTENA